MKHRDVDQATVRIARQGARLAAVDRNRRRLRQRLGVVDLDHVLLGHADVGERHARLGRAGEHDVAGLVPDCERGAHVHGGEIHHAHIVRKVVHHPRLTVGERGYRHGLEPDRDFGDPERLGAGEVEHREAIVRGVHDQQPAAARRHRQRVDVAALEMDEVGGECSLGGEMAGDCRQAEPEGDERQEDAEATHERGFRR